MRVCAKQGEREGECVCVCVCECACATRVYVMYTCVCASVCMREREGGRERERQSKQPILHNLTHHSSSLRACARTHTHTHTHKHKQTHTHTHTHTGIHLFQSGARVRRKGSSELEKIAGTSEYRSFVTWAEYEIMQGDYTLVAATFRTGHHVNLFFLLHIRRLFLDHVFCKKKMVRACMRVVHAFVKMRLHVFTFVYICVHVFVYFCMCLHVFARVCICT